MVSRWTYILGSVYSLREAVAISCAKTLRCLFFAASFLALSWRIVDHLLCPESVRALACKCLADKHLSMRQLCRTALHERSRTCTSVFIKMALVPGRETTRPNTTGFCLMSTDLRRHFCHRSMLPRPNFQQLPLSTIYVGMDYSQFIFHSSIRSSIPILSSTICVFQVVEEQGLRKHSASAKARTVDIVIWTASTLMQPERSSTRIFPATNTSKLCQSQRVVRRTTMTAQSHDIKSERSGGLTSS